VQGHIQRLMTPPNMAMQQAHTIKSTEWQWANTPPLVDPDTTDSMGGSRGGTGEGSIRRGGLSRGGSRGGSRGVTWGHQELLGQLG
jgi:hypothetical protein